MDLNDRIAAGLAAKGVEVVRVDGDLQDHPEFHSDYDAFVAPHYEADVHNGAGGTFWGRAAASLTGPADDRLGNLFWSKYRQLPGVPPEAFQWNNVNVTDYYGFRLTSDKTPGVLVEHGVGWGADKAWLRDNIQAIADTWVATLVEFGGVMTAIPVLGRSLLEPGTLAKSAPTVDPAIPALYESLSASAGIVAEVAFAQALHETANFTFPGTAKPDWHNPAGLGVTGAPDVGNRFPDWETGIRAHLGHLLWYFGPTHPVIGFCDKDQRHFGGHKLLPNDLSQLNGKWAIPGTNYSNSINKIIVYIRSIVGSSVTDAEFMEKYNRLLKDKLEQEFLDRQAAAVEQAVKAVAAKLAQ